MAGARDAAYSCECLDNGHDTGNGVCMCGGTIKSRSAACERDPAIPLDTYISHALTGAAWTARMFWENPDLTEDARKFGQWAEAEFLRIGRKEVGERDLIG